MNHERSSGGIESIHVMGAIRIRCVGLVHNSDWDGTQYFVTFIDDFTYFAIVYILGKKSEVFRTIQEYIAMVTPMHNIPV